MLLRVFNRGFTIVSPVCDVWLPLPNFSQEVVGLPFFNLASITTGDTGFVNLDEGNIGMAFPNRTGNIAKCRTRVFMLYTAVLWNYQHTGPLN